MPGHNFWSQTYKGCGCNVEIDLTNDQIMQALYEAWLEQGNTGTEQEFLDSLQANCDDCGGFTPPDCGDGQVMKYNVTSGEWECGDDNVGVGGTDTLASLSCGVGQLPKWNGTSWECADDIDTDTDTTIPDTTIPNTDVLADLDCGEGQVAKYINGAWVCAEDLIGTGGTTDTNTTISYRKFRIVCYTDGASQSQGTCMEQVTTNETTNTSTVAQLYFDKNGDVLDPNLIVACVTETNTLPTITDIFDGYICYEDVDGKCNKGEKRIDKNPNTDTVVATRFYDKDGNVLTTYTPCDCCTVCEDGTIIVDPMRTCEWVEDGEECFEGTDPNNLCECLEPTDALQARALTQMQSYYECLKTMGQRGVIFEYATIWMSEHDKTVIPGDCAKWNALDELVYKQAACYGVDIAPWATGEGWGWSELPGCNQCGYGLNPYEMDSNGDIQNDTCISIPMKDYHCNMAGISFINLAGHEFSQNNQLPQNAPSASTLQQLTQNGRCITAIRYPLGEPAGGGVAGDTTWLYDCNTNAVDPALIGHVSNLLNNAQTAGIQVVLDVLHPGQGDKKYATICGQNVTVPNSPGEAHYKNYILSLMNHTFTDINGNTVQVKNHPALLGVDIVNEPHEAPGGNTADPVHTTVQAWETFVAMIMPWYRNTVGLTADKVLYVSPARWGNAHGLADSNAAGGHNCFDFAGVSNDPNFFYAGHYYPDRNNAGLYDQPMDTYQENLDLVSSPNGGNWSVDDYECLTADVASCEKYTKEVERYTDAPFEICGGTRYKNENGVITDVSGLNSCTCPVDNGGGNTGGGTTYVSCERPAGYPICPVNLAGWHRETGATDADGNPCVVGWNGTGECWFDPNNVPQQED